MSPSPISIPTCLSDNDKEEIKETICNLIGEYIHKHVLEYMYPDFKKRIYNAITPILELLYSPAISDTNLNFNELFVECFIIYFTVFGVPRSHDTDIIPIDKSYVKTQLARLRLIPQHEQNTEEWFKRRWNLLTASSAWKALGSESMQNALIYSKCKPIDKNKYSGVNINSATHHGHKFEPLSMAFYEDMYDTQIEEFGCLPDEHDTMLGASPDGINCKYGNKRYGYLLEIKNPVSRKLTGIPKLEYWIQMQFQMHITQLPYCDFMETQFKQYENESYFIADGTFNKTTLGRPKGIIVCFHDGIKPVYKYPPWNIDKENYAIWHDKVIDDNMQLTWINNTYWYLENYSCVTVAYNKPWFIAALPYFKKLWNTVLKERVDGYSHRVPKRRNKNPPITSPISPVIANNTILPSLTLPPPKMILKIRRSSLQIN